MTRDRAARHLATWLAVSVVAVTGLSLLLWVADGMQPLPVIYGRSPLGVGGIVAAPLTFAAVGGILASRLPRNPIGWLFLVAGIAVATMLPVNLLVATTLESLRPASPAVIAAAWVRTVFAVPVMLTVLIVAALIFPTGHPLPGRWRWAVWGAVLAGVVLAFVTAADPTGLSAYPAIPNPTSFPVALAPVVDGLQLAAFALAVACIAAAIGSVWTRYRQGDAFVRAQLRWITYGVTIAAVAVIPYLVVRFVVPVGDDLGELFAATAQIGSCAFPIAAAFAISRYRLFDVDVLIGRTLVYLPLTAMLGGLYTAGIALFQRIFVALTGETSDVAIVLAILVVATAFTPLRRGLEGVVDRRFPAEPRSSPVPGTEGVERAPGTAALDSAALLDAGHADGAVPAVQLVPIDPTGTVACPLGPPKTLYQCLTCPYLVATVRRPTLAIACRVPPRA